MDRNNLTANRLKHLFHYDGEKGRFTRNISRGGSCAGELAGSTRRDGYVVVRVDYKPYLAHRLAWFYVNGSWPEEIDHINGDRSDNRICNLRECTRAQNQQNMMAPAKKYGSLVGASWNKLQKAWVSSIRSKGFQHYLGQFETEQEAHNAYLSAKAVLHTFQPVPR